MTKMATTSMLGKNLQQSSSTILSYRPMSMKRGMEHYVTQALKFYINDEPVLTLTYFTTTSNLALLVFVLIVGPDIR